MFVLLLNVCVLLVLTLNVFDKAFEGNEEQPEKASKVKWVSKVVMGSLGLLVLGMIHQFTYVKKLPVFRDSLIMVEEDERIAEECGELERYKWYDVRAITFGWDWRPRAW